MPVFLSKNIAVELDLNNGSTGTSESILIRSVETIAEKSGLHHVQFTESDCIIVKLDDITVKPLHRLDPNHIPIFQKKCSFEVSAKTRKRKKSV